MNKKIHIIGGGTVFHLRPHFALCSPAYGNTARTLATICRIKAKNLDTELHLTKMAGGSFVETNNDISELLDKIVADPSSKIVFLTAALCDFEGTIDGTADKNGERLKSRDVQDLSVNLTSAIKVVQKIRATRKDIFAIAFKSTCGATSEEQYIAGLNLLKESSVNLVFANDIKTKLNMIVTPEESHYHESTHRIVALENLVDMAVKRSNLAFTRSTVIAGEPIPWKIHF